jgi:hypothetical protein
MMLIKFPGEPAIPLRIQSLFILGAVLTEAGVVDNAASMGETAGLSLLGTEEGLISGVSTGGVEATEVDELLLSPPLLLVLMALSLLLGFVLVLLAVANFPAVCFVTAAAIPPLSLACFLSFLEEGIQLIWASVGAVSYPKNARVSAERSCQ